MPLSTRLRVSIARCVVETVLGSGVRSNLTGCTESALGGNVYVIFLFLLSFTNHQVLS